MYLTGLRRTIGVCLLLFASLAALAAPGAAQEPYRIQGRVVDATTQQPLPNVSVALRGRQIGTLTDNAGRFTLIARVPAGAYTLAFSLIGRGEVTRQLTLGAERSVELDVVPLQETALQLEGLVVTGAGVVSERRAVGSQVATVSGQEISQAPAATRIDQALQGKVAGALITQNNGQPGGGVSIRLRGTSSILGGAEPLIVIDGVLVDNNAGALVALGANASYSGSALSNRLADLSPEDIERVEILKGAAAAALYGSRANNGVIQIFTKRGQQGEPVITFSTEFSASATDKRYDLLTLPQAGPGDTVYVANGTLAPRLRVGDPIQRYDYQDEIFRTGYGNTSQLSISGGSEGTSYYLSGSVTGQQGILEGSGLDRVNARAKLSQRLGESFQVTANGTYVQSSQNLLPEGEQAQGVLTTMIFTPTSFNPAFDPVAGRYPYSPVLGTNPFDVIENWQAEIDVNRFLGSFQAEWDPIPGLNFSYLFGFDDTREENTYLQPAFSTAASFVGTLQNPTRSVRKYNNDLIGNYLWEPGTTFSFTTTAGFRQSFDRVNIVRATAQGLNPGQETVGSGGATPAASQDITELLTIGGFVQEQVGILDRYFLTLAVNTEASSAFGEDERWQLFPRFGLSWVVQDEPFFAGMSDVLSTLRLRASYGESGGQPPGAYYRFDNYNGTAQGGRPGYFPSSIAGNPDLRPERKREWEAGFEVGILDNRISADFTAYSQSTIDLVLPVTLNPSSGFSTQYQNIGEVSNRGLELVLNTLNLQSDRFTWRSRLTYSANRNRVEDLGGAPDSVNYAYLNYVIEGQPVGVFYGAYYPRDDQGNIVLYPRSATGAVVNDPTACAANPTLRCLPTRARSANGVILRRILGNPEPDFSGSLSNDFEIGDRVQLSFLLDGRFGNEVANFSRRISDYFGASPAMEREIRGEVPKGYHFLNTERHLNYEEFVEDGSFVKLREVAVRFRFDQPFVRAMGAETLDLFLAGRNLATWTNYSGIDPEINLFSANTVARGVDFGTTPIPRTFVVGLNFGIQ